MLQRWNLPEFMCAFCPYVQMVTVNVSVFTLTAIAVDRHRAIINPLRYIAAYIWRDYMDGRFGIIVQITNFQRFVLFNLCRRARPPKYVCKIVITLIWIVSLLFGIPIAISLEVIQVVDERISEWRISLK